MGHTGQPGVEMPRELCLCQHCGMATWHYREWTFPRSPGLTLLSLLVLPLVWWYDPWDFAVCGRRARRELVKRGFHG